MIRLAPRYAELATTTNFSFLRGASHPEELVARAAALGLAGMGIADRNTLAGVVRAHVYARENREALGAFRVVTGARLVFVDGAPDVIVYPQDRAAYGRLTRLLSAGQSARAERRVPPAFRRVAGERGGAAGDRDAPHPTLRRALIRRFAPPSPASGRRDGPSPACGRGVGVRAGASLNCAKRFPAGCGSAPVRLTASTCAAGWRRARRWRESSARR